MTLRLGTRGSPLALAQSGAVAAALRAQGLTVEVVTIRTEGDRLWSARLADVGGKGLFVREIEEALQRKRVDLAVHSLKDLPAEVPAGLVLGAFPAREDPRDVLVTRTGGGLDDLPKGAVVGTSSPRRRSLVLARRPDLRLEPVRGNVDTRLRKVTEGTCDATILAAAGLRRLGIVPEHAHPLDAEDFVPAVGQGIVAVEVREDDPCTAAAMALLDHEPTRVCAVAERAYLRRLGASCTTPMAAHARVDEREVRMVAVVASEDGRRLLRGTIVRARDRAESAGRELAESLLAQGAAAVAGLDPARMRP